MKRFLVFMMVFKLFIIGNLLGQGLYLGAGLGNSFYDAEFSDLENEVKNLDKNATSYKFFGGFQSESFFNIEGGYRSFGEIKSTESGNSFESKTTGWDVSGLGRLQLFDFIDILGKAGVIFWNTESIYNNKSQDGNGTAFLWGIGAGVHLWVLGIRLEWENFEVDEPKSLSTLSLSATYGF